MKTFDDHENVFLYVGRGLLFFDEREELLSATGRDSFKESSFPWRPRTVELFLGHMYREGERDTGVIGVHIGDNGQNECLVDESEFASGNRDISS